MLFVCFISLTEILHFHMSYVLQFCFWISHSLLHFLSKQGLPLIFWILMHDKATFLHGGFFPHIIIHFSPYYRPKPSTLSLLVAIFHRANSHICMSVCVLNHFSCLQLFVTPWTVAHQSTESKSVHGFLQARILEGLWCPPRKFPEPGIKPASLMSPALAPPGSASKLSVLLH